MADTFNNDLRVREQEAGSNSGTWEVDPRGDLLCVESHVQGDDSEIL